VGSLFRIKVGVIQSKTIFGVHLLGQVCKLFISDDFQRDQITGIQRNISSVAALMKEILLNRNHAYISVMAASRKQVTHLLRINVVQQIV